MVRVELEGEKGGTDEGDDGTKDVVVGIYGAPWWILAVLDPGIHVQSSFDRLARGKTTMSEIEDQVKCRSRH